MTMTTSASDRDMMKDGPDRVALAGRRLHFVGIGGCGMSGLARIAQQARAICTGSDMADSSTIQALQKDGFAVALQQSAASVPADCDWLIISAAIHGDHPEVQEARRRGIKVVKYAQLLGQLMIGRRGIAVAGTHGKSSTTSLLSHVLIQTGLDPSFIVGATCRQIGGGSRVGGSDLLVAEACEFDRSFHNFHPTHSIILNVEEDHLDVYDSLEAIVESFRVFAHRLPDHGSLLINHEMAPRLAITAGLNCKVETIGFAPQADWQVSVERRSTTVVGELTPPSLVTLMEHGEEVCRWLSPLPGEHMAYNAAAAAVTAHRLGAPWNAIIPAIESFQGLDRRMQRMGVRKLTGGEVVVVDDYGHHPTEVDTTLRALRRHYRPQRLLCVFQPHQHSRTRFLMEQFAASFSAADVVIVPHIYFVRDSEAERHAVQAGDLVDRLRQRNQQAMHLYPFGAIVEQLDLIARPGDLLVTMGAGDVWKIARDFLAR
jgi:UDP-N-acetylmuramate--alanine ligase